MTFVTEEKIRYCESHQDCHSLAETVKFACKTAQLQLNECLSQSESLAQALLISANMKLDYLATGGLIALALALNLAYMNLTALRFQERLRKFVNNKLEDTATQERLKWLIEESKNDSDQKIAAIIYRLSDRNHTARIDRVAAEDSTPEKEHRYISDKFITRVFYSFVFNRRSEASPVPTMDKVICAVCSIACVAILFRDTAAMMGVIVSAPIWIALVLIPSFVVSGPIIRASWKTGTIILIACAAFALHLSISVEKPEYLQHKGLIDFIVLTTSILVPTLFVAWSNTAYPNIENTIGSKLDDLKPQRENSSFSTLATK